MFTCTLFKADFASWKGRASPTSTKVSIFAWDCVQMNFFAWFSCLFLFGLMWVMRLNYAYLCTQIGRNVKETIGTVLKTRKVSRSGPGAESCEPRFELGGKLSSYCSLLLMSGQVDRKCLVYIFSLQFLFGRWKNAQSATGTQAL